MNLPAKRPELGFSEYFQNKNEWPKNSDDLLVFVSFGYFSTFVG